MTSCGISSFFKGHGAVMAQQQKHQIKNTTGLMMMMMMMMMMRMEDHNSPFNMHFNYVDSDECFCLVQLE